MKNSPYNSRIKTHYCVNLSAFRCVLFLFFYLFQMNVDLKCTTSWIIQLSSLKPRSVQFLRQLQLKYNPGLFPTVTMQKNQLHNFTPAERITNKIYFIREQHVLLDQDLADLYDVETKHLIQAVKRNKARFPVDFMFQLSNNEFENLRSQIVTSNRGGRRYLPYAFTEQGVAMLSSILKSDRAVHVNIAIMRTFVQLRRLSYNYADLLNKIEAIERKYD